MRKASLKLRFIFFPIRFFHKNKADGIVQANRSTVTMIAARVGDLCTTFSNRQWEVPMSDMDRTEKLIVTLGQRMSALTEQLQMIAESLQCIESHLRQIAISSNPAPNYQRLLSEYPHFDWTSIGATVLNRDGDGAMAVEWNGQIFTRRSPNNKFDAAIWFSRCVGKDADGNNKYARLISFRAASEAEPIASKARKAIGE